MNSIIHQAGPGAELAGNPATPSAQPWDSAFLELPEDLRNWFCDLTLIEWIRQELTSLHLVGSEPSAAGGHQVTNLSVLAFSLASCIFGSEQVARACHSDPGLLQLCSGRPPFSHELFSARLRYRTILQRVLTAVFRRAILCKFGLSSVLLPVELEEDLRNHAAERLDLARHLDQCD